MPWDHSFEASAAPVMAPLGIELHGSSSFLMEMRAQLNVEYRPPPCKKVSSNHCRYIYMYTPSSFATGRRVSVAVPGGESASIDAADGKRYEAIFQDLPRDRAFSKVPPFLTDLLCASTLSSPTACVCRIWQPLLESGKSDGEGHLCSAPKHQARVSRLMT